MCLGVLFLEKENTDLSMKDTVKTKGDIICSTVFLDVTQFSPIFLHTHVLVISLTSQVYEPTSYVFEYFETLL